MSKPLIFTHRTVEWWNGDINRLAGADFVELDVRKTRDDVLVVSHFRSLKNTVRRVLVDKNSYADLVKKSGKKLPKLDKVVGNLNGQVKFNFDLKQQGMLGEIIRFIKRHRIEKKTIIDSCYCQDLEQLAEKLPGIKFAYTYNYRDRYGLESFKLAKAIGYFSYFALFPLWPRVVKFITNRTPFVPGASLYYRIVNKGIVDFFHSRDIPVYVWPVNREADMRKMVKLGVDGIKTSKPALLKQILDKHTNGTNIDK